MKLQYNPISFVLEKGDETTKLDLLEFLGLLNSSEAKELTLNLLKTQMANGGFPSRLNPKIAGVKETCRTSILLFRCGISVDKLNIQAAVNFLLKHQREKGGWSENPELRIPKEIVGLSNEDSVAWITADVIDLLRKVSLGSEESCLEALNWLRLVRVKMVNGALSGQMKVAVYTVLALKLLYWTSTLKTRELKAWIKTSCGIRWKL